VNTLGELVNILRLRYLVAAAFILMAAGCSNRENYKEVVNSWLSAPVDALIAAWGPASDMYTLPTGQLVLEYHHKNILHVFEPIAPLLPYDRSIRGVEPVLTRGSPIQGPPYSPYSAPRPQPRRNSHYLALTCKTSFVTDRNWVISGWEFSGDNCISRPPPNSEVPANLVACSISQAEAGNVFLTTPADCARAGGRVSRR
jgi:hypothetical protein